MTRRLRLYLPHFANRKAVFIASYLNAVRLTFISHPSTNALMKLLNFEKLCFFILWISFSISSFGQRANGYDVYGDTEAQDSGFRGIIALVIVAAFIVLKIITSAEFRQFLIKIFLHIFVISLVFRFFGGVVGIAYCVIHVIIFYRDFISDSDNSQNTQNSPVRVNDATQVSPRAEPTPIPYVQPVANRAEPPSPKVISEPHLSEQSFSSSSVNTRKLTCPSCKKKFLSTSAIARPANTSSFVNITCPNCGDDWVEKSL